MSAKYPYFGKKGRPSKTELQVCKKINDLIFSGKITEGELTDFVNSNGQAMSLDELEQLYTFMSGESVSGDDGRHSSSDTSSHSTSDDNFDDDLVDDISDSHDSVNINEEVKGSPDAMDFDPFAEPVIERGYTSGDFLTDDSETISEEPDQGVEFEEDDFVEPSDDSESVSQDVGGGQHHDETSYTDSDNLHDSIEEVPFEEEEDIPEAEWNNTVEEEEEEAEEEVQPKEPLGGDNLQDLSPAQKRKSAEKTADAVLQMYGKFAPLPFKSWAKFKDSKIQKMAMEGRIDLKMPLENGITVQDYIDGHNEQVEEIFEMDDDTRMEIRDPLIDVLMEQELALTPTQRLMMAFGSHVVTMSFSAFKLASNNKQALESFEKFHTDMKASGYASQNPSAPKASNIHSNNNSSSQSTVTPQYSSQEFSSTDKSAVEELLRDINSGESDVIDPEHDSSVTVEEVNID